MLRVTKEKDIPRPGGGTAWSMGAGPCRAVPGSNPGVSSCAPSGSSCLVSASTYLTGRQHAHELVVVSLSQQCLAHSPHSRRVFLLCLNTSFVASVFTVSASRCLASHVIGIDAGFIIENLVPPGNPGPRERSALTQEQSWGCFRPAKGVRSEAAGLAIRWSWMQVRTAGT